MKRVTVRELEKDLRRHLNLVRTGETLVVTDGNGPIAEIRPSGLPAAPPSGRTAESDEDALRELERKGIIRRGTGRIPAGVLNSIRVPKEARIIEAILEEREEAL